MTPTNLASHTTTKPSANAHAIALRKLGHDINNDLSAVVGALYFLKDSVAGSVEARTDLSTVEEGIQRIKTRIEEMFRADIWAS